MSEYRLIDFYRNEIPSDDGDKIDQICNWDRDRWEASHLSIQWVFPTKKQSAFNPEAPLLDDDTIHEFKYDPDLRIKFHEALISWMRAYGIILTSGGPELVPVLEWEVTTEKYNPKEWLEEFNHNHLRVTRILECLMHLGFDNYAKGLFHFLTQVEITGNTYQYWRKAVYG
jgi:hypothetical protein